MVRRSASAVYWSVPGARPMPRSIRPGCSASSVPNCSATTSGAWLGSITPPEPTRIVEVAAARWAISTAGAELAMAGMLWCSATQNRRYPSSSVRRASVGGVLQGLAGAGSGGHRSQVQHGQRYVAHLAANPPPAAFLPAGPAR